MILEDRIRRSIGQRAGVVVLSTDFAHMASASQVGRVLARLVQAGVLVRVSKGAYAKARPNRFTGQPSAAGTLESIAAELFSKLNIEVQPSQQVQVQRDERDDQPDYWQQGQGEGNGEFSDGQNGS